VRNHIGDFDAFRLSVELLEHIHWRSVAVRTACEPGLSSVEMQQIIETIASRDAQMVRKLRQDWDRTRFPDSPAKTELLPYLSCEDQTLFNLSQAADFTARLAAQPGRLVEVLRASKQGE
jgi:hypothetical protein